MRFKSIVVGIFFGILLVVGLFVHKDYGIPWDESIQRKFGLQVYDYVLGNNEQLLKNSDRYYGPPVEFFLVYLEKVFNISDIRDIYLMRHLVNYTLFILGVFFFFLLLNKRFKSVWWGMLGALLLILSPRIFAHSFYNSKDIVFMASFMPAVYFGLIFIEKKRLWSAVVAALATALLIDIRVMGVLFPAILLGIYFLNGLKKEDVKPLLVYFSLTAVFVVIFWPILWKDSLGNFIEAFNYYPQKTSILYFGDVLKSTEVPWHYTLGWIAVTTPIAYLVLFLLGIKIFIKRFSEKSRVDLIMLAWLVFPLLAVMVLKSVLHDGWRQMFFIYPSIIYFAVFGLTKSKGFIRGLLFILLIVNLYFVMLDMVISHPYQNLYLNEFIKPPYEKKFELDYWGLSYKEGLEYIARIDKSQIINVAAENLPGENNIAMLSLNDRLRFKFVKDRSKADYYLTNYRGNKEGYYDSAFYIVEVKGTRILGVYKLK